MAHASTLCVGAAWTPPMCGLGLDHTVPPCATVFKLDFCSTAFLHLADGGGKAWPLDNAPRDLSCQVTRLSTGLTARLSPAAQPVETRVPGGEHRRFRTLAFPSSLSGPWRVTAEARRGRGGISRPWGLPGAAIPMYVKSHPRPDAAGAPAEALRRGASRGARRRRRRRAAARAARAGRGCNRATRLGPLPPPPPPGRRRPSGR
jgi:hypothetical protein